MKVIAEASPAFKGNPHRLPVDPDGGQIVLFEVDEYVQVRYLTVAHEGAHLVVFDTDRDVWRVVKGQYDGCEFSDLIITP